MRAPCSGAVTSTKGWVKAWWRGWKSSRRRRSIASRSAPISKPAGGSQRASSSASAAFFASAFAFACRRASSFSHALPPCFGCFGGG